MRKSIGILIASILALPLAGCDDDKPKAEYFATVQDCAASGKYTADQCETEFAKAAEAHKNAPRFSSENECGQQYGRCQVVVHEGNSVFVPFMLGYMMGGGFNSTSRVYYAPPPTPYRGTYSAGYAPPSAPAQAYSRPSSTPSAVAPSSASSVSRGGFGSTAHAVSSGGSS